eukprot:COSAG01_NODE_821_length_13328_cov_2.385441_3_plen_108_part_00
MRLARPLLACDSCTTTVGIPSVSHRCDLCVNTCALTWVCTHALPYGKPTRSRCVLVPSLHTRTHSVPQYTAVFPVFEYELVHYSTTATAVHTAGCTSMTVYDRVAHE